MSDKRSILPRNYNDPPANGKPIEARIDPDGVYCGNCDFQLGENYAGGLKASTFTLPNRTILRCIACREKNEFKPGR